jgi:hypothetical protein
MLRGDLVLGKAAQGSAEPAVGLATRSAQAKRRLHNMAKSIQI